MGYLDQCVQSIQVTTIFNQKLAPLASQACSFISERQDHTSSSHPWQHSGQSKRKNIEEKKKKKRKRNSQSLLWALHIPFLSITRLIPGHRCSFWMSDPADRCFPLSLLSLSLSICLLRVSISACTLSSHC